MSVCMLQALTAIVLFYFFNKTLIFHSIGIFKLCFQAKFKFLALNTYPDQHYLQGLLNFQTKLGVMA